MPDTYVSQNRRANARQARHLLNEWDDVQKPALERVEKAARDFLHALDMARAEQMFADEVKAIDAFACDTANGALNLLGTLIDRQRRELSDVGGDADQMYLVRDVLETERDTWEARWAARKA